jgi:hypothetical protein
MEKQAFRLLITNNIADDATFHLLIIRWAHTPTFPLCFHSPTIASVEKEKGKIFTSVT